MDRFRWIIMSSFLMLLVQFKAAGTYSFSNVRVGDEVTLSCGNVTDDQDQDDSIDWFLTRSGNTAMLFEHGQIQEEAKAKSDRLSVTENFSLVIKNVSLEDAGGYICIQFRSGLEQGETTVVFLNIVTITEEKNDDTVTLNCSVSTSDWCFHTVKWLYEGHKSDLKTEQVDCSATATFTSHLNQKSEYYELLKCEVKHSKFVHLFTFSPPQSPGDDATTTNKSPTTTGNNRTSEETNNPTSENNTNGPGWWKIIVVFLGLATLISVAAVIIWRVKGNKTRTEGNIEHDDEDEDECTENYENNAEHFAFV
ncbi:uncharacterized protein LOC120547303 isoform X2 [Perca fluviatilis]|uniref:uncharacterized protein LOC120547303 isoform X2 n=1 Tax=Perca fluviatilis TaxID=8168 RepID=UPI0019635472|nr:uncharacterized protein LOC120547303 isoform X2 [Perca fluviatilis]